jgi:hypothetical protein
MSVYIFRYLAGGLLVSVQVAAGGAWYLYLTCIYQNS